MEKSIPVADSRFPLGSGEIEKNFVPLPLPPRLPDWPQYWGKFIKEACSPSVKCTILVILWTDTALYVQEKTYLLSDRKRVILLSLIVNIVTAATTIFRVATVQGKQGIWFLLFPDRQSTGNLVLTQGKIC